MHTHRLSDVIYLLVSNSNYSRITATTPSISSPREQNKFGPAQEEFQPEDLFQQSLSNNFSRTGLASYNPRTTVNPSDLVARRGKRSSTAIIATSSSALVEIPEQDLNITVSQPSVQSQVHSLANPALVTSFTDLKDTNSHDILSQPYPARQNGVGLTNSDLEQAAIALHKPRVSSTVTDKASSQISVAQISISDARKITMAKQRAPRPEKRHLVRWSDELDKKLLLAIQSKCNQRHILLPWDAIGKLMGEHISGGAVIQHLAKLRTRMVSQGLDVPPPLRRGGGPSIPARLKTASKITPSKRATARAATTKSGRGKKAVIETSDDDNHYSDSDAEYGEPTVKRTKTTSKGKGRRKVEDSDDEVETPTKRGKLSQGLGGESKMLGKGCEEAADLGDDAQQDGEEMVAAGAPFLSLVNDSPEKDQTGHKCVQRAESLVVTLPFAKQIKDTIKSEEASSMKDGDSRAAHDDPNEASSDHAMAHTGGPPIQTDIAFAHTALPSNAASYGSHHNAHVMFPPNIHQRTQSDMTYIEQDLFSPGPRPDDNHFSSIIHDQHTQYPAGFEDFGGANRGRGDLPVIPNLWQSSEVGVYNDDNISAHFENAWDEARSPCFQDSFHGHSSSIPQCSTTYHGHSNTNRPHIVTTVPDTVYPSVIPAGGDYSSAGGLTVEKTPSSEEAGYTHDSWPVQNDMSAEGYGVNHETDDMFAAVGDEEEYDHEYSG
ncbi:hypothetical protein N7G274_005553 [Stereocaulon virgatum]|uniref:Uncharacterized protein n=1 Tax=Stereocaulon virgatum TaxID=373712 RepID=A0ABR4A8D8_9LECA